MTQTDKFCLLTDPLVKPFTTTTVGTIEKVEYLLATVD